jgi:hypothetical protein
MMLTASKNIHSSIHGHDGNVTYHWLDMKTGFIENNLLVSLSVYSLTKLMECILSRVTDCNSAW